MENARNRTSALGAVDKALQILAVFSSAAPELGISELAERLGLPNSTIHRLAGRLLVAGFLAQNETNRKYRLGLRIFELGSLLISQLDVRDLARPYLEHLAAATGETVHLSVLDGPDVVYIDKIASSQPVHVDTRVGGRNPAFYVSTGKALLAHLPGEAVEVLFDQATPPYPKEWRKDFLGHLEVTRKIGYATNRNEWRPGVASVGAAIFDHSRQAIAAIGIVGPVGRFDDATVERLGAMAAVATEGISATVGYRPVDDCAKKSRK
ncbi:MAG: IclR family transcriptional regulator [Chloroflexi bacterium]|nr:IclR family transcriptional regulator [Chloroflexota bacterium]